MRQKLAICCLYDEKVLSLIVILQDACSGGTQAKVTGSNIASNGHVWCHGWELLYPLIVYHVYSEGKINVLPRMKGLLRHKWNNHFRRLRVLERILRETDMWTRALETQKTPRICALVADLVQYTSMRNLP
jgi:hypothetical protein